MASFAAPFSDSPARAFLVSALLVLAPALLMAQIVASPTGNLPGKLLDWTICAASSTQTGRPATSSKVQGSEALAGDPNKRVTSTEVTFPPNAFSPEHHHEADLYVYVLEGTIVSQLNSGPIVTYTKGQSFFEPEGSVHTFAENPSTTEPARILAVFVHRLEARLVVYH
jgi:quercetin dioxygenase-like cupin family protein